MGGGLMQLVAYGAQDVYLTGQPQITFFKVVYRRHTNFSVEPIVQTFSGSVGSNKTMSANLSRNGDLISNVYFVVKLGGEYSVEGQNAIGIEDWISTAKIEIGGSKIDEQKGAWMDIWYELTRNRHVDKAYRRMIGKADAGGAYNVEEYLYIPLQFWFCRNPGLALPLIALQYHDVRITIKTPVIDDGENTGPLGTGTTISDMFLLVDYIYLDAEERKRFAQASHEYLIEQVQENGEETLGSTAGTDSKIRLNFNHPCKFIAWTGGAHFAKLTLNGHERFAKRRATYFKNVQCYQHFKQTPGGLKTELGDTSSTVHINNLQVYSFALNPADHQPSGTCNFSRIDNATLILTGGGEDSDLTCTDLTETSANVYAMNYNVLRIMSGMGGLAYSN